MGEDKLTAKKGEPTHQFDSVEECIEAIESEFSRLFGSPWVLSSDGTGESWEEYKTRLIQQWSEKR